MEEKTMLKNDQCFIGDALLENIKELDCNTPKKLGRWDDPGPAICGAGPRKPSYDYLDLDGCFIRFESFVAEEIVKRDIIENALNKDYTEKDLQEELSWFDDLDTWKNYVYEADDFVKELNIEYNSYFSVDISQYDSIGPDDTYYKPVVDVEKIEKVADGFKVFFSLSYEE
jgi:hypothetical protein